MSVREGEQPHRLRVPVSDDDWQRGPAAAPATLVEYFDYQCSHCQEFYPVLERLVGAHPDALRFVVRHFPVSSSHERALDAALAAEAAGRQGKFWQMHALLMESQERLERDDLLRYAHQLRLDRERFAADMADSDLRRKIEEGRRLGIRSGVNGTPTLFLNGVRYDGPRDLEALSRAVRPGLCVKALGDVIPRSPSAELRVNSAAEESPTGDAQG